VTLVEAAFDTLLEVMLLDLNEEAEEEVVPDLALVMLDEALVEDLMLVTSEEDVLVDDLTLLASDDVLELELAGADELAAVLVFALAHTN
jgi:hypothetical protein